MMIFTAKNYGKPAKRSLVRVLSMESVIKKSQHSQWKNEKNKNNGEYEMAPLLWEQNNAHID